MAALFHIKVNEDWCCQVLKRLKKHYKSGQYDQNLSLFNTNLRKTNQPIPGAMSIKELCVCLNEELSVNPFFEFHSKTS